MEIKEFTEKEESSSTENLKYDGDINQTKELNTVEASAGASAETGAGLTLHFLPSGPRRESNLLVFDVHRHPDGTLLSRQEITSEECNKTMSGVKIRPGTNCVVRYRNNTCGYYLCIMWEHYDVYNLEEDASLQEFLSPRKDDLFKDIGHTSFQSFNEKKQKVFNGAVKGTEPIRRPNDGMKILALCADLSGACLSGVSLTGKMESETGPMPKMLHFRVHRYENPHESSPLIVMDENNTIVKQFSFQSKDLPFGCAVITNAKYAQFVSNGEASCRMTLTVIDYDINYDSTKNIADETSTRSYSTTDPDGNGGSSAGFGHALHAISFALGLLLLKSFLDV
ncbi:hypothetical protein DdX_15453 [Ditylenchus destructor]|uniref:Uncharacterized protein n=1 Tax=Ditylenchus destructor TaxID=166010 RepID=A0AAD4MQT0_9BILA|nr:hypothetical protein DdX_15453 [Ditylenchus destructor]